MFFDRVANLYVYLISVYELSGAVSNIIMISFIIISMALPYMLGSVNFGILISKYKYKKDIREEGSGNAGATNMLRVFGRGAAAFTLAGDVIKCIVGVIIGGLLIGLEGASIAGLFCVMGHIFPCWHRFKGGKGVAAAAAVAFMISPLTFAVLLIVFLIILFSTKFVSLASVMSALLFPLFLNTIAGEGPHVLASFAIMAAVVFMHRSNIKRLQEKTEPKLELFGKKKKDEEPAKGESADEQEEPTPKRLITKNTSKKKLNRRK